MRVRDVMSTRVLSVRARTPLKEVAEILIRNRIGGLPVTDPGGGIVGIVSESDLQPTKEGAPMRPIRAAGDVMSRPIITLSEEDTVTRAARVLQRHRIKRAPVVRNRIVVGMVTPSDLLRPYLRTDSEIRADVEEALLGDGLGLPTPPLTVSVDAGVVRLQGSLPDRRQRAIAVRLARGVEGVIDIRDDLRARDEKEAQRHG